jgi:hypothetical protein
MRRAVHRDGTVVDGAGTDVSHRVHGPLAKGVRLASLRILFLSIIKALIQIRQGEGDPLERDERLECQLRSLHLTAELGGVWAYPVKLPLWTVGILPLSSMLSIISTITGYLTWNRSTNMPCSRGAPAGDGGGVHQAIGPDDPTGFAKRLQPVGWAFQVVEGTE